MKSRSPTLDRVKKIAQISLMGLLLTALALTVWALWPISVDPSKPDPAVTVANELTTSPGNYTEGYSGEAGSRLHYVYAGLGEPIIFLHGFPSYWFTMFGLMEEFKSEYQVIAVDGLGVGKSEAPRSIDDYKLEKLVAHLDAVLEELDLESAHLVGHDWGAAVATAYAQTYPEKTKTLTAMSALPLNIILARQQNEQKYRDMFSYVSTFTKANPVLIKALGVQENIWQDIYAPFLEQGVISARQAERLQEDIGQARRLNRFIHWYRANFPDAEDLKEEHFWPKQSVRLTVPAQFIYGDQDPVVTQDLANDFKRNSDAMKVMVLPNVAHRPHYEEKQTVTQAIRSLITQK